MSKVQFCENNFFSETEWVVDKLKEEYEDVNVEVESCLGYCGECAERHIALVNDELVTAESVDELHDSIIEIIQEGE